MSVNKAPQILDPRIQLPLKLISVFTGANFNNTPSVNVTLSNTFTSTDSMIVVLAPGSGQGGVIDPNLGYLITSTNTLTLKTGNGQNSTAVVDGCVFGF